TDMAKMQEGFDKYLELEFGALKQAIKVPEDTDLAKTPVEGLEKLAKDNPKSYPIHQALGMALRKAGRIDDAIKMFEQAATLAPTATGMESPHGQLAQVALEKKDRKTAIAELTKLFDVDFENLEVAQRLAALQRDENVTDPARTRPVYERIVALDP